MISLKTKAVEQINEIDRTKASLKNMIPKQKNMLSEQFKGNPTKILWVRKGIKKQSIF